MNTSATMMKSATRSKDMMIFILVLSLSGLENLIAEIIPELQIGPIELGISSFIFVPIILCILFDSFWACLAAPLGEIVFADLPLGEFGGLGEFEEVILLTIGLFLAAKYVRDLTDKRQIAIAAFIGFGFEEICATFIDMGKVWFGIEEFEAVAGLPQSVFAVEMADMFVELVITGVIFGIIPTVYFLPKLYRRIEPLLGIKPREAKEGFEGNTILVAVLAVFGAVTAMAIAFMSEMGINIVEWEPEFLDQFGMTFILFPMAMAAVVAIAVFALLRRNAAKG